MMQESVQLGNAVSTTNLAAEIMGMLRGSSGVEKALDEALAKRTVREVSEALKFLLEETARHRLTLVEVMCRIAELGKCYGAEPNETVIDIIGTAAELGDPELDEIADIAHESQYALNDQEAARVMALLVKLVVPRLEPTNSPTRYHVNQ